MASRLKDYAKTMKAMSGHHGALHRALGVPEDKEIPADKLAAALNSKDPHIRRMAATAKTFKGFKH